MSERQINCTVMFVDFVGSTRLYDLFGNLSANQIIDQVISQAGQQVCARRGVVVKTIGDELMCRFESSDQALHCAAELHRWMDQQPEQNGFRMALRIGLHAGPALLMTDGDLYGDAVNVAARMAGLSRARQIILSADTLTGLDADLAAQVRVLDRIPVKGKQQPMTLCQFIWEPHEATFMAADYGVPEDAQDELDFVLNYQDRDYRINSDNPCLMFGRDELCDLVIEADHVSRRHARVEYRRGKFVLIDQSTNGTFVTLADGREVFLRGEEMTLWGDGVISIGTPGERAVRTRLYFHN